MKIASSSASFAPALARGELTQLEWLDLCANELELDGIVFDATHFPRIDGEYLAQLKKCAVDLGLAVAGVSMGDTVSEDGARWLEIASVLGAPLVITTAAAASGEAAAWGRFTESLKARVRDAKRVNVTLALRGAPETLCTTTQDLARATKDVDSAWLRYALDVSALAFDEPAGQPLSKTVIALHTIGNIEGFAADDDREAASLVRTLERFRGFVVLEAPPSANTPRNAYHIALERFAKLRATHLTAVV